MNDERRTKERKYEATGGVYVPHECGTKSVSVNRGRETYLKYITIQTKASGNTSTKCSGNDPAG